MSVSFFTVINWVTSYYNVFNVKPRTPVIHEKE